VSFNLTDLNQCYNDWTDPRFSRIVAIALQVACFTLSGRGCEAIFSVVNDLPKQMERMAAPALEVKVLAKVLQQQLVACGKESNFSFSLKDL
jgi:hypothetical protein